MQLKVRHLKGEIFGGGGCAIARFNTYFAFGKTCNAFNSVHSLLDGISENISMSF
jgi:hypothetical protein